MHSEDLGQTFDRANAPSGQTPVEETQNTVRAGRLDSNRFTSLWSVVGVQYSATASPLAIGAYLQLVLGAGGSPFMFWSLLLAVSGQFLVAISLAELASALPHTSGTVYWVVSLAPLKNVRFLSYFNGVLICFGWLFVVTSTVTYASEFLLALVMLNENYVAQAWHVYLVATTIMAASSFANAYGLRIFPALLQFTIIFMNAAAAFIFIALLITARPKASASTVFIDIVNETGWESNGLVFFLAILPGLSISGVFDSAAHLSEELAEPERQVPKVMIYTTILNMISTIAMLLAMLFSLAHPENLLEPLAGLPILQLCMDAWPSMGFVKSVAAVYFIANMLGTLSVQLAGSRLWWSFFETNIFPFSRQLRHVNQRHLAPVNAIFLLGLACCIVLLLILGPSTVMNGFLGSAVIFFAIAYAMPIFLLLSIGRQALSIHRPCNLGRVGPIINVAALCWITVAVIFVSFPMYRPITTTNMNWAPVFAIGIMVVALINWALRRSLYELPHGLFIEGLHLDGTAEVEAQGESKGERK